MYTWVNMLIQFFPQLLPHLFASVPSSTSSAPLEHVQGWFFNPSKTVSTPSVHPSKLILTVIYRQWELNHHDKVPTISQAFCGPRVPSFPALQEHPPWLLHEHLPSCCCWARAYCCWVSTMGCCGCCGCCCGGWACGCCCWACCRCCNSCCWKANHTRHTTIYISSHRFPSLQVFNVKSANNHVQLVRIAQVSNKITQTTYYLEDMLLSAVINYP